MTAYLIFIDDCVIYRKIKLQKDTPIEACLTAICSGEIGEGDGWSIFVEDDYEDALDFYGLEEAEDMEYFDMT